MRRVGRTLVLACATGAAVLAFASPAQALPQVFSIQGLAPSPNPSGLFMRGAGPAPVSVRINTTELATFGVTAPNNATSSAGTCNSLTAGFTCSSVLLMGSVDVAVSTDADVTLDEPVSVFITPSVAGPTGGISWNEGSMNPFVGPAPLFFHAEATGVTGGEVSGVVLTALAANPGTDALVTFSTTAPSGGNMVAQGGTITYSATLTRTGMTSGQTSVTVLLNASGAPNGTSVVGSNQQVVTFGAGETGPKNVSFDVAVSPTATPGNMASYAFRSAYDPTGTDGDPIDSENGATKTFSIIAGTPRVCSDLTESTTAGRPVTVNLNCTGVGNPAYALVGAPSHGAFTGLNAATGQGTYTPTAGFSGTDTFTYKVTTEGGASNIAQVSIGVSPAAVTSPNQSQAGKKKCKSKKKKRNKRGKCVKKKKKRKGR